MGLLARRILRSFGYAFAGIVATARTQPNFVIHLVAATCALALAVVLQLSPAEIAVLALTIAAVLAAEMLNTAVEALADLVSPEFHPLVKVAKDAAAGAVLITALGAILVGLALFLPRLISLSPLGRGSS